MILRVVMRELLKGWKGCKLFDEFLRGGTSQPWHTSAPGGGIYHAPAQSPPQPPAVPWDPQRLDNDPAPDWPNINTNNR
jgi:hypothetical protein